MKIALLHRSVLPAKGYGGIERVIMNLASELKRLGHQVTIVAFAGSLIRDFEFVPIPLESKESLTHFVPKGMDFVHFQEPIPIEPSYPYLVSIYGNGQPGERFLPNSNFTSRRHAHNHGSQIFVHHGLDLKAYPFESSKEDYYVFMGMGYLKTKNLKACVEWAHDTKSRVKVIGGFGFSDRYVQYLGFLGESEGKLEILSRARGFLFPVNWEEPFALAPLEALATGTPVIASRNGGNLEAISADTGVCVSTYSEFCAAKERLTKIKPAACRQRIENEFSLNKMTRGYLSLYEKILSEGSLKQRPATQFHPEELIPIHKASSPVSQRFFYFKRKLCAQMKIYTKNAAT